MSVITGAVVSTTSTVLITSVATFGFGITSSVALYVTVYVPTTLVLTVEVSITKFPVKSSNEQGSIAVAPCSMYPEQASIICGLSPNKTITGPVASITLTVLMISAVVFPLSSVRL